MSSSILIIDDDADVTRTMLRAFHGRSWSVASALTGRQGIESLSPGSFDVVLLDLQLPDLNGMLVLQLLLQRDPDVAIILLTGHGNIPTAVEAMQLGAENFLAKPFELEHLHAVVERALEKVVLRRQNRFFSERAADSHRLAALGTGPVMERVVEQVDMLAATDAAVLLQGETGTGKGWTAELIHALSLRPRGPLVPINCAGLSGPYLESELFGHEKGAFPDAKEMRRGLVEIAQGGTLFLDEIGDLTPEVQPKLLRFLDDLRFRRVGGTQDLEANVRLLFATRHDLRQRVREGRFREDLFYRITAHAVVLPPLRERGAEAVGDLAYRLLSTLRGRVGRGPTRVSDAALDRMIRHTWPGNVRELRNTLEHALIKAGDAQEILPRHLPLELAPTTATPQPALGDRNLATTMANAERRHIQRVLEACEDNRSLAARELGISRATLYEKLKRLGIEG